MKIRLDRTLLVAALSLVALIGVACQSGDETSPSATSVAASSSDGLLPTGSPAATSPAASPAASPGASSDDDEGEETSVFDLEEGDCFGAAGDQVETVTVVDCEDPHVYEVFSLFDYEGDGDEYPGEETIQASADEGCDTDFEEFVGVDYQSSRWFITSVTPSEQTWADGDREIVCTLNLEDLSEVTGSAEGSGE